MKKFFLFLLILILLILGFAFLVISGKVPALTKAVFKQVELGVQQSPDEIYTFYDEIGYENNLKGDTPKSGDLVFEGGIDLDRTFTQNEINSWIAAWQNEWSDLPFKNSQIKINTDGTVEASSSISVATAESFGKMLGYTQEEIDKAKSYLKYIPDPLPLYAKGSASITQNDVVLNVQDFKVGTYSLPSSLNTPLANLLENVITRTRKLSDYTSVQKAIVTPKGVEFVGTVPASVNIK